MAGGCYAADRHAILQRRLACGTAARVWARYITTYILHFLLCGDRATFLDFDRLGKYTPERYH